MNPGWKTLPCKNKTVRILNIVGLVIIVVMLAFTKDRFPKQKIAKIPPGQYLLFCIQYDRQAVFARTDDDHLGVL